MILTQSQLDLIQRRMIYRDRKRFFSIARYTGQNVKAICNLKVSDVYNEDRSPLDHIKFSGIKSGMHSFLLYNSLNNALITYSPENFIYDGWLFPSRAKKGKPITSKSVYFWFKDAVARGQMEHLNLSMKDVRESFIFELCRSGMSTDMIMTILGMSTVPVIASKILKEPIPYSAALQIIFG